MTFCRRFTMCYGPESNILSLGSGYVFAIVTLVLSQTWLWLGGQKPDLTNGMIHQFHGLPATWCDRMCMKQCLTRGKLCTVAWQTITAPPAVMSRCSCRLLGSLPLRWPGIRYDPMPEIRFQLHGSWSSTSFQLKFV